MRLDRRAPSAAEAAADGRFALFGEAVAANTTDAPLFRTAGIKLQDARIPLVLTRETIELRCTPRDLPESSVTLPADDLDHVVHIICSRFEEPDTIERFLEATSHIERPWLGREAWFEVEAHPTDESGSEAEAPLLDDVFVARYPDIESWERLNRHPDFIAANEVMDQEATTLFDLLVVPSINRLAHVR